MFSKSTRPRCTELFAEDTKNCKKNMRWVPFKSPWILTCFDNRMRLSSLIRQILKTARSCFFNSVDVIAMHLNHVRTAFWSDDIGYFDSATLPRNLGKIVTTTSTWVKFENYCCKTPCWRNNRIKINFVGKRNLVLNRLKYRLTTYLYPQPYRHHNYRKTQFELLSWSNSQGYQLLDFSHSLISVCPKTNFLYNWSI